MKATVRTLLVTLVIGLMLFSVLPSQVPIPIVAGVEQPAGATPWRPYGPYVEQVLVTVFSNDISELSAFNAGQLDWFDSYIPSASIPSLTSNPDALVSQPGAEAGFYGIEFNHRYPILGVPQQEPAGPCSTNPSDPQYVGLYGSCSTMKPTEAGIQVRKAIAHIIDKTGFASASSGCAGAGCVAIDDPIPAAVCLEGEQPTTSPTVEPCSQLTQRNAWENAALSLPHFATPNCPADIVGVVQTPCAYREAAGPGLGVPSLADKIAACEHILAAGLTLNNGASGSAAISSCSTVADSDSNGLEFSFPSTGQTVFAIRSDDSRRLQVGNIMADALDSLFEKPGGTPVVFRLYGNLAVLGPTVFNSIPDTDWGLYTGDCTHTPVRCGLDATHLFPIHDSGFASDFCGGTPSLFNNNYGFYCNNAFDLKAEQGTLAALSLQTFNALHREAVDIAGKTVMSIPVFSRVGRTLVHNGWTGSVPSSMTLGRIVDVKGAGFADTFNWLNMRAKPGYTGSVLGPPGGSLGPDTLRAGFRQGTSRLNIFHASSQFEWSILAVVYDTLGRTNPRAAINPFFEQYETSMISVDESFVGTGPIENVSDLNDDGVVNILDLVIVGLAFGSTPTSPNWNPAADVNDDGTVNIFDLVIVGINFGTVEPRTIIDVRLRNDLMFHDGVMLTAQDVAKSFLAYRDGPAPIFFPLVAALEDVEVPIPASSCGNLCARLIFKGHSFLHKLNMMTLPILPLHLWDTGADGLANTGDAGEGDGFICSPLGIGSCAGLPADGTTAASYDPVASVIMVGHGPFVCFGAGPDGQIGTGDDVVGGPCSQDSLGNPIGQSVGTGGRFILRRFNNFMYGSPTVEGTPLHNIAQADINNDWKVDLFDFSLAAGNPALQALVIANLDKKIGGTQGQSLNEVDLTNNCNAYEIGPGPGLGTCP